MIKKLLIAVFQKRINICVEEYQADPNSYLGKLYKNRMQTKLNVRKALKQDLFIPDLRGILNGVIHALDSNITFVCGILGLLGCPFYNLYKLIVFPGRLYLSRVVRAEILKRINNG